MAGVIVKVQEIRELTTSTYVIRMDRGPITFKAGQYLRLGIAGDKEKREYSIYSGENEPFIEVLIREVEDGSLSKSLRKCQPGKKLEVEGPFGFFKLTENERKNEVQLIASGTGIAPFHSFVKSYSKLRYTLVHGIRYIDEAYESGHYENYTSCTSRDGGGKFKGRVTDYIHSQTINPEGMYLLCGNSNMIHDVMDILTEKGVPLDHIRAEVYF